MDPEVVKDSDNAGGAGLSVRRQAATSVFISGRYEAEQLDFGAVILGPTWSSFPDPLREGCFQVRHD